MAELRISVDGQGFQDVATVFEAQAARLALLLEQLHPDHTLRQLELPVGDLATALADAQMLGVTEVNGLTVSVRAHPALVKFGELLDAISDAIATKVVA
jgi:hypothetical protein